MTRWERTIDVGQTCLVWGIIVSGFAWTAYQREHGQCGTSHTLHELGHAYPGIVLAFGVWFGAFWRPWVERHPWLFGLVAMLLGGHCLWSLSPW